LCLVVREEICAMSGVARVTRCMRSRFVPEAAAGVAGGVLDHPQQQREPAELEMRGDPVLTVVALRLTSTGHLVGEAPSQVRRA